MATSKGTNEPKFTGTGKRAGVLGPKTAIANTSKAKATGLQKGKAKGGATQAPNAKPGANAKSFGQGKATDNRSAKKGN